MAPKAKRGGAEQKVGPKAVARQPRPDGRQQLRGPTQPWWNCGHCGTQGVWANRLSCHACNCPAPRSVQAAARKEHDKAERLVNPSESTQGNTHVQDLEKKVEQLQSQLKACQEKDARMERSGDAAQQPGQSAAAAGDGDASTQAGLQAELDRMEYIIKNTPPQSAGEFDQAIQKNATERRGDLRKQLHPAARREAAEQPCEPHPDQGVGHY